MRVSSLILGLICCLPVALADRTSNAHNRPTVCNNEPTADPGDVSRRFLRGRAGSAPARALDSSLGKRNLFKRSGKVTYDPNCDKAPPDKSS